MYNTADCYWLAEDGRVFSSQRSDVVPSPSTDKAFKAWKLFGYEPRAWPRDGAGRQTNAALAEVLAVYGLHPTPRAARDAAINAKRDAVVAGGYRHPFGGTVGTRILDLRDARDETAWLTVASRAAKLPPETPFPLRDARNDTFVTTAGAAVAAMEAMADWRIAVSQHSWDLKDSEALDIEEGWPA